MNVSTLDLIGWSPDLTLAQAAEYYASRRWSVFPLKPGTKVPATRHGVTDASTDLTTVRQWWAAVPAANIGISTAGMCVIDVDVPIDDPGAAWSAWCAMLTTHSETWPDTWTVDTPSGGTHVYYLAPEREYTAKNTTSRISRGIDTRGTGGYVVAAPSAIGGESYDVVCSADLDSLPVWLADRLADPPPPPPYGGLEPAAGTRAYGRAALAGEIERLQSAPVGERNNQLNSSTFALATLVAADRLDEALVIEAMTATGLSVGLSSREVEMTIKSALRSGLMRPRGR